MGLGRLRAIELRHRARASPRSPPARAPAHPFARRVPYRSQRNSGHSDARTHRAIVALRIERKSTMIRVDTGSRRPRCPMRVEEQGTDTACSCGIQPPPSNGLRVSVAALRVGYSPIAVPFPRLALAPPTPLNAWVPYCSHRSSRPPVRSCHLRLGWPQTAALHGKQHSLARYCGWVCQRSPGLGATVCSSGCHRIGSRRRESGTPRPNTTEGDWG